MTPFIVLLVPALFGAACLLVVFMIWLVSWK